MKFLLSLSFYKGYIVKENPYNRIIYTRQRERKWFLYFRLLASKEGEFFVCFRFLLVGFTWNFADFFWSEKYRGIIFGIFGFFFVSREVQKWVIIIFERDSLILRPKFIIRVEKRRIRRFFISERVVWVIRLLLLILLVVGLLIQETRKSGFLTIPSCIGLRMIPGLSTSRSVNFHPGSFKLIKVILDHLSL